MAGPSLDEKLNAITEQKRETETQRKIDLETSRQQDRRARGAIETQQDIVVDEDVTEQSGLEAEAGKASSKANDSENQEQSESENPEPSQVDEEKPEGEDDEDKDNDEEDQGDEDEDGEEEGEGEDETEPEGKEGSESPEEASEAEGELGAGEGAAAEAGAAEAGAAEAATAVGAEAGAAAGAGAATATAPIWGTVLAIILILAAVMAFLFILVVVVMAKCNEDTWSGTGARTASTVASWVGVIPADVCDQLAMDNFSGGSSGGGGASSSFDWAPTDLVALSGVAVDGGTSDPRVRQCMLGPVQGIFSAARAAGLTVTITSAFRNGDFPSRHAFGEAVDIALRPVPATPWSTNQQIARLVQIAKSAGFNPPVGDTLDEYNSPVERTSGGHVHIEFNKISTTESHCGPYPNPPAPTT